MPAWRFTGWPAWPGRSVAAGSGGPPVSLQAFLAPLFWACLLPLVALAAGLAWAHVQAVQARQAEQAAQLAAEVVAKSELALGTRLAALRTLAGSPALDDPAAFAAVLPLALAVRRTVDDDLVLADASLQPLLDTARPAAQQRQLPRLAGAGLQAAAQQAMASGQPVVGDVQADAISGLAQVPSVVPVLRAGQAPRLLLMLVDAEAVQRQLQRHSLPPGWGLTLRDRQGVQIAHHGWPAQSPRQVLHSAPPEAGLVQQRSALTGHSVTVLVAPAVFRAPVLAAALAMAAAVLSASLLGLVGAHLASRRLGRLLARLLQPDPGQGTDPGCDVTEIAAIRQALADAACRRADSEATLLASEARFRQLFRQAPLPQMLVAADGRMVDLNQQFSQAFGYQLADLPDAQAWNQQAYPDAAYRATVLARRARAFRQAQGGEVVDSGEYRVRCRDGSLRQVQVKLVQIGDLVLSSWLDVSAQRQDEARRQQAQAEATEAQRRAQLASLNLIEDTLAARRRLEAANAALQDLSQALEQSAQAVVITDPANRIEYVNEAFVRQTGYARAQAVGQPMQLLKSGRTPAATYAAMHAALARGETWRGEFINRRRDGRLAVDAAIVTPLRDREGGAVKRYMALLEDVTTQRHQAEELQRHRHHLEELVASRTAELEAARAASDAANQAKSAFLANMSHEIRTPLNAVIGLNHLQRLEPLSPTQQGRLDKIDAAAQHLLAIISDILDLSKIEAGQMRLEQLDFALAPLLDGVRAMVAATAADKGLVLGVQIDTMPLWLRGDPTRLRQALLNFASNAVKFTARGRVLLRVRLLGRQAEQLRLRFEVQDTGIGIAADQLRQLFEPFAQADVSTTRRFGGTGLGLAITRRLVELMGGELGADSQPGQGSCFWFTTTLGLGQGRPPPPAGPLLPAAGGDAAQQLLRQRHAGARVLVVEDNAVNREVAESLLQAAGLQVDSVDNGRLALDRVRAQAYRLVLMDMQLPEMDGLQASRAMRADPALAGLPIVAMTANAFAEDRQACLAAGMDDFVAKPVNAQDLYATLLRCLDAAPPVQAAPVALPAPAVSPPPAAPADEPSTLAQLLGPGFALALARLRGDQARHQRLLQQFIGQQQQDPERIQALLQLQEPAEALRLAHDLKGAASTLGADALAMLAAGVQAGLRPRASADEAAAVPGLVQQLQAEMQRLVDGLGASAVSAACGTACCG